MYKDMSAYISVSVLATGAALTVGLLVFSGMFALLPSLPLALVAMFLAVGYEGEVYVQNIRGAWDKMFKPRHHEHMIAKAFLRQYTPESSTDRPQFFEDLLNALEQLDRYEHTKNPKYDPEIQELKEQIERMEEYFTNQLFDLDGPENLHMYADYEAELNYWLSGESQVTLCFSDINQYLRQKKAIDTQDKLSKPNLKSAAQELLAAEKQAFSVQKWLSVVAGFAMGLGTTYLLVEAFTVLPIIVFLPVALWPVLIVPLAIIAGAAYGFLTYNALTDMWHNKTLQSWLSKLQQSWAKERTYTTLMVSLGIVLLLSLTVALTICTAGTWWTIVKEIPALFVWMKAVPVIVFQLILALLVGAATLIFNVQNTMETLEFFYEKLPNMAGNVWHDLGALPGKVCTQILQENPGQAINPFRLIRLLIAAPLRYLLFVGHLISEAFGSTRLPGVPDAWSTVFGFVSNFFQDFLYFFNDEPNHDHSDKQLLNEHFSDAGHDHSDDLPTRCLKAVFYPILIAEIQWDFYTSKLNTNPLTQAAANERAGMQMNRDIDQDMADKCAVNLFASAENTRYKPSERRSTSSAAAGSCC